MGTPFCEVLGLEELRDSERFTATGEREGKQGGERAEGRVGGKGEKERGRGEKGIQRNGRGMKGGMYSVACIMAHNLLLAVLL